MRIAICDDESVMRDMISSYLGKMKTDFTIEFETFKDGQQLLSRMQDEKKRFDIYILDIIMPGIDGYMVAKEIYKKDAAAIIIFLTNTLEFATRGYEVEAFRYLTKPVTEAEFIAVLKLAIAKQKSKVSKFVVQSKTHIISERYEDILYFERIRRKIRMVTLWETYEFFGSFSELCKEWQEQRFLRPHTSFFVNPAHIINMGKTLHILHLRNGSVISVSRSCNIQFQKDYNAFLINKRGAV